MIQELGPLNVRNHLRMDTASNQRNPQSSGYAIAKRPVMKVLFGMLLFLLLVVVVVVVVVLTHSASRSQQENRCVFDVTSLPWIDAGSLWFGWRTVRRRI